MNIYKRKYGIVKNELCAFGKKIGLDPPLMQTQEFWKKRFAALCDENTWDHAITSYLAFECNCEEREFICAVFFESNSIVQACARSNLSEKTAYVWREHIYSDLIGLAMQRGLIFINIADDETSDSNHAIEMDISDEQTEKIMNVLGYRVGRVSELKRVLSAIHWIEQNGNAWKNLPSEYGSWRVIYNIYNRWRKSGKLDKINGILGK